MRTIVIVQARFASTRLPGKTMLCLGAGSVLAEVLARCRAIAGVDEVCCAVSDGFGSDILADEAERSGARAVVGSEVDVLARYLAAARATAADVVLRVTSDCPLIDSVLCATVLAERARAEADYCVNNAPPTFPHGLDCEAFTRAALERSAEEARAADDREHVTPYMARQAGFRRSTVVGNDDVYARQRWTLDHPEDYAFLHRVHRRLGGARPPWRVVAEMVACDPALSAINAMRVDAQRYGHAGGSAAAPTTSSGR